MKLRRLNASLFLFVALVCTAARGEEIILKDGQKIVGTIVGYEQGMFRVETDYGIALVRKDKVASIQVNKPEAAKPSSEAVGPGGARPTSGISKPDSPMSSPETPKPPAPKTEKAAGAAALESAPNLAPPVATSENARAGAKPSATPPHEAAASTGAIANHKSQIANPTPPSLPVSQPMDVPLPEHLQEHVEGNTYFNDTFQFSLFKPPDWKTYEGVPKETGSGIMAMGTEDEQTLLIVDRQVWSGAPKLSSEQVEVKLRQTYQEYRRTSEEPFICDGQPAIRRTFTGILDGTEWHGVAVHVIRGNMVFGIIGLTAAETFAFQQGIFSKIIKTFHFLTPAPATSALGQRTPAP
jgi:hypothetical protein